LGMFISIAVHGAYLFRVTNLSRSRSLAEKFEKKLEIEFGQITRVYPEAILMFVCRV
jgi:hypothetical protein